MFLLPTCSNSHSGEAESSAGLHPFGTNQKKLSFRLNCTAYYWYSKFSNDKEMRLDIIYIQLGILLYNIVHVTLMGIKTVTL